MVLYSRGTHAWLSSMPEPEELERERRTKNRSTRHKRGQQWRWSRLFEKERERGVERTNEGEGRKFGSALKSSTRLKRQKKNRGGKKQPRIQHTPHRVVEKLGITLQNASSAIYVILPSVQREKGGFRDRAVSRVSSVLRKSTFTCNSHIPQKVVWVCLRDNGKAAGSANSSFTHRK